MLSVYKGMEVIKGNARVGCTQQGGGTGGWRQGHGGGVRDGGGGVWRR